MESQKWVTWLILSISFFGYDTELILCYFVINGKLGSSNVVKIFFLEELIKET